MPKYRKLHVKTVESLDINDMPDDFTRLTWVLLPLVLDREGRGMDNAAWLKSRLFPLRLDVTAEMITAAMDWFASRGMVRRYQVQGRSYFWVPTFPKYQGDTKKEAESEYPAPPEPIADKSRPTPDLLQTNSASDADADSNTDTDTETAGAGEAPGADAPPPPSPPAVPDESTPAEPDEPDEPDEPRKPERQPSLKLSAGQREVLELFGAARFKTVAQRDAVLTLEQTYGTAKLLEAAKWAAVKGMTLGDAITNITSALPTWGHPREGGDKRKRKGGNGNVGRRELTDDHYASSAN